MADRATIRVAVPQGWARGVLAGVEAAFAGWGLITVFTMIAYLTLRSNSWMNDTTPRDALGLGGDLWAAVIGGTSVVGGVHYRAIPTLVGALLIVLVRILLRATAGFPRSAALFAVPGFLLTSWLLAGASGIYSHWWTGTLGAILIPLIGSVWFVASGYSRDNEAPAMQHWISGGLKLGGLSVLALVAASAVASVIALVAGWSRMAGIQEILGAASGADTAFIVGAQLLFAPTVMAWAASWWSGAGFLTATDSLHSPVVAGTGPIPPIPLLGAVPETAPGMWVILAPIALGIGLGVVASRSFRREHLLHQTAQGVLSSVIVASVTALWMWSATMSLGSVRLASMGPRVGWATLALVLEIALPALIIALATHPTTRALLGEGAGRVRNEGEALRRRAAERASRVGATASTADEAWAEASDPAETGDTEAGADEAGAEDLEAVVDTDEQAADEMPGETSETAAEGAADIEPVQAEGDEEDPETKATRREGLN
ncbi:putative membrane protein [Actinomyces sp. ICM39]|nr:putative membrane protein [Actinomyces sp. ICM39]